MLQLDAAAKQCDESRSQQSKASTTKQVVASAGAVVAFTVLPSAGKTLASAAGRFPGKAEWGEGCGNGEATSATAWGLGPRPRGRRTDSVVGPAPACRARLPGPARASRDVAARGGRHGVCSVSRRRRLVRRRGECPPGDVAVGFRVELYTRAPRALRHA